MRARRSAEKTSRPFRWQCQRKRAVDLCLRSLLLRVDVAVVHVKEKDHNEDDQGNVHHDASDKVQTRGSQT